MTHPEMDELYELFVLRALEHELASEIEKHLRDGCDYCQAKIDEATVTMAAFAEVVPLTKPPQYLKERVLSSIQPIAAVPPKRPSNSGSLFALMGACAALLAVAVWFGSETNGLKSRLNEVSRERNELEAALKSLSRSGTRTIQFGKANEPQGKVFVNPSGGLVFVASRLPQIASDRTFQLWLVPPTGAPRSAGLFHSDQSGSSVQVSAVPVDPATTKAVAVSVEPAAGSTAPTTTPIIVAALE